MTLTVEFDREADGRWIAEVAALPGVLAYGRTRKEALANVQAVAFAVLASDVKRGRRDPATLMQVQFVARAA
ncbi:MAG: type II toxin-antitoxin system HicB family antitoxin [Polyangiaceae bacterium]